MTDSNVSYPVIIGTYDSIVALLNSIKEMGVKIINIAERTAQGLVLSELQQEVNLTIRTIKDLGYSTEPTIGEIMRKVNKIGELGFCDGEEIPQFVLQHSEEIKQLLSSTEYLYFAMQPVQIDGRTLIFVLYIKDDCLVLDATQVGVTWRWDVRSSFIFVQL